MAEVKLNIHGRPYGISCDEGQEERVFEVGQYVDERARDIATAGAASNETHLLVLTSLVLADEIKELRDYLETSQANTSEAPQGAASEQSAQAAEEKRQITQALINLTERIDGVAERLESI